MYSKFAKVYDKFMKYSNYGEWEKVVEMLVFEGKPNGKRLLDIGCGTGELLLRLTKNYSCDGMDLSENMLKVAEKKLKHRDVKLFLGDMVCFDTGYKYDIMVSLFDTVNHILSVEELQSHLLSVYNSLNDEGVYIFDVVGNELLDTMFPGGIFFDNRKDLSCIWERETEDGLDYIDATFFIKRSDGNWERMMESYCKKIFTSEEIENCISNVNLKLLKVIENNEIAGKRNIYLVKKTK